jgi:prevent-host-death family protein
MQTISKNKLKPRLLAYMRGVEKTQIPMIITDRNVPVLQLAPYKANKSPDEVFRHLQGRVKYHEDVWSPDPDSWGDLV